MIRNFTPEGVADISWEQYEKIQNMQNSLRKVFADNGYRQIQTPTFEYYDLFSGMDMDIDTEEMYKIVNSEGKMMVLRPDATIPVARMVATNYKRLSEDLKFMYFTSVFRSSDFHAGEKREFMQAGLELFGDPSADADGGLVNIAIDAMKAAGFDKMKIELGDSNYFLGLIEEIDQNLIAAGNAPLGRNIKLKLREMVECKNIPGLKELTDSIPMDATLKDIVLELPMLYGDIEKVLEKAALLSQNDKMTKAVENVRTVKDKIREKDLISGDMGLVNQPDYYSGILFKIYIKNAGMVAGSGGRYDSLMKKFGKSIPAAGFGLNLDVLYEAMMISEGEGTGAADASENKPDGKEDNAVRIALGKGRLADTTIEQLANIGIVFPDYSEKSRKLIFTDSTGKYKIVLVKAVDVGIYVEKGACDIGVIGKDTLMESMSDVYEVLDLGYGKCTFSVAGIKGYKFDKHKKIRVATKYPRVAKSYFESMGRSIEIIKINGSVELAPIVGLSDVIVDIVETGTTLRENGLEVIEKIADISARLILNRVSSKTKQQAIEEVIKALENRN